MKHSYFLDTSALFKIYHREIGTIIIEELYEDPNNTLYISQLSEAEFTSTLFKKLRANEINIEALQLAQNKFAYDCKKRFEVLLFHSELLEEAKRILNKKGNENEIRTLDAIQLSAYMELASSDVTFVCADKKLNRLVKNMGFNVFNYEF